MARLVELLVKRFAVLCERPSAALLVVDFAGFSACSTASIYSNLGEMPPLTVKPDRDC